jgi:hypothetical protein
MRLSRSPGPFNDLGGAEGGLDTRPGELVFGIETGSPLQVHLSDAEFVDIAAPGSFEATTLGRAPPDSAPEGERSEKSSTASVG